MMSYLRSLLLTVVALIPSSYGQEAKPSPAPQVLEERAWMVPLGFFPESIADPSNSGKTTPALSSAQAFLEASGITFPEGSFARYEAKANKMVIRNTPENLELVDTLMDGIHCFFPNPAVDIVALDCPLATPAGAANGQWPTEEEIRKLPVSEVKVVSQISTIVKSGVRILSRQTFSADGKGQDQQLSTDSKSKAGTTDSRSGEYGARLEVEPVVGPDGLTVELNYSYRLRRQTLGGNCAELNLTGALLVQDNSFKVFHVSPLEKEGRALVLIAGVRLLDFDGTKTPSHWEEQGTP